MKHVLLFILSINILCSNVFCDDTIEIVTLSPAHMQLSLQKGIIDGFIVWEPFCAEAAVDKTGEYFLNSDEIWPDHPCCVLTTILKDEAVIERLIWAHLKAVDFMEKPENKEAVLQYAKEFTGKENEVIELSFNSISYIRFPEIQGLKKYLNELQKRRFFAAPISQKENKNFWKTFVRDDIYRIAYEKYQNGWQPKKIDTDIKLGFLTADLHQLAYYIAEKRGFFLEVFNDVKTINFKNGPAVMNAYKAGLLDAAYLGSAPAVLKSINEKIPISIIGGANNNGSAIITSQELKKRGTLANSIIATPGFGTVQDLILRIYAAEEGIQVRLKE